MRVLHVAPRFPPAVGGGERHVARLTAELVRRGLAVHVLTTKLTSEVPHHLDRALPDEEEREGVHVHRVPIRRTGLPVWGYGFTIPDVAERVARVQPDIVHLHGYGYHVADRLARRRRVESWKLVMTSHGFLPGRGILGPVKLAYDAARGRTTVAALDAAVAVTPRDQAVFEAFGARRCEVIPNGVEFERFAAASPDEVLRRRLDLPADRYVINTSRLERLKGQDLLIQAFARLVKAGLDVRLVLAGEGTATESLRRCVRRLSISRHVRFTGALGDSELASLVKGARAFAHTPRDEPFGIAILEAMAASVPVLATDVGGIPFATAGAALLVPPHVDAIAGGLKRVLFDEALREAAIPRGVARARSLTWAAAAARVEALYRAVCSRG